jgi:protein-tyrosine phosphatase
VPDAVAFEQIVNFRDIGGHATATGARMRTGVVFRSGHLADATDRDLARLSDLGVRAVIDLRDPSDLVVNGEDRHPVGVEVRRIPYPGGEPHADIQGLLRTAEPGAIERAFPPGAAHALVLATSATWALDAGRRAQLRDVIRFVVDQDGATLIQCSAGKDRTGFAAALIQASVGVPDETVICDYLRSNEDRARVNAALLHGLAQRGVITDLLEPLIVLREEYIRAFLSAIRSEWGSVEGYLRDGLGLDAPVTARLQDRLLH